MAFLGQRPLGFLSVPNYQSGSNSPFQTNANLNTTTTTTLFPQQMQQQLQQQLPQQQNLLIEPTVNQLMQLALDNKIKDSKQDGWTHWTEEKGRSSKGPNGCASPTALW